MREIEDAGDELVIVVVRDPDPSEMPVDCNNVFIINVAESEWGEIKDKDVPVL